jgi:tetratricopeptide (TPR) repeat protein/uncharacterized iron-regulated protein
MGIGNEDMESPERNDRIGSGSLSERGELMRHTIFVLWKEIPSLKSAQLGLVADDFCLDFHGDDPAKEPKGEGKEQKPKFFDGTPLSDNAVKRLGKAAEPETLTAIGKCLNEVGQEPRTALANAFKTMRLIGIGEAHWVSPNGLREDGLALVQQMVDAKVTHFAVEINTSLQGKLDDFLKGKITADQFKTEFYKTTDHQGKGDDWLKLMKEVHDAGITVMAVDNFKDLDPTKMKYLGIPEDIAEEREKSMAGSIGKILEDPNTKVVFWVGSDHLQKGIGPYKVKTAGERLREVAKAKGFEMAIFAAEFEDQISGRAVSTLSGMASKSVAFAVDDVPEYAKLRGAATSKFENVILYPMHHVLSVQEQKFGPNDPRLIPTISRTALTYADNGNMEKALALEKRAKDIAEKVYSKDSPEYVERLVHTGQVYDAGRKEDEAREQYKLAFETAQKLPPAKQLIMLEAAARLDNAIRQGRDKSPEHGNASLKALGILKDHPELYRRLCRDHLIGREEKEGNIITAAEQALTILSRDPAQRDKATQLAKALLDLELKHEPPGHSCITDRYLTLFEISKNSGKTKETEQYIGEAIGNAEKGKSDANLRDALAKMGTFQLEQGKFQKAEESLKRVSDSLAKMTDPVSWEVMHVKTLLGKAYAGQDKTKLAEECFKEAIKIAEEKKNVPKEAVQAYVELLKKTGRQNEAEELQKKYPKE